MLFTGCGVTGKCNTGTGGLAHISECHHLYVYSRTPGVGDIIVAAVYVCPWIVPGTEYSLDGLHQLLLGIGGEILSDLLFIFSLKLLCQPVEILSGQLYILSYALFSLHPVNELFKIFLADFHNNVGEHLDKSSVAVPCPARIAGLCSQNLNYFLIQAQV